MQTAVINLIRQRLPQGLVVYAYAPDEHMLAYVLTRARRKQEQWDCRYRYQPSRERD